LTATLVADDASEAIGRAEGRRWRRESRREGRVTYFDPRKRHYGTRKTSDGIRTEASKGIATRAANAPSAPLAMFGLR
jgi:hypothetical protein